MTRRKGRANGRTGLWQDLPDTGFTPVTELEPGRDTTPLRRPCPHCHAAPRQPCTRAGRGGRIPLKGYHDSRKTVPDQHLSDQETNP